MDRHARHRRPDADPRRRPTAGYRTRGRHRFERTVSDALASLPPAQMRHLRVVRVVVEEVPRPREGLVLSRWEEAVTSPGIAASTLVEAELRLYRHPLERRAEDHHDLRELVREVVSAEIAAHRPVDDG